MKTLTNRILMAGMVLALLVGFVFAAHAQDATPEATPEDMAGAEATAEMTTEAAPADSGDSAASGTITCDSDLILNLYIAERYFGFGTLRENMMASGADMSGAVDLATIDKGQFTPFFDSMMSMGDMSGMTDEQMTAMSDMMMMDETERQAMMDEAMSGVDTSGLSSLNLVTVAGEAAECSSLRAELYNFFTNVVFQDMSMGMMPSAEGTMEAGSSNTGAVTGDTVSWSSNLSGANEVPGPGDPEGTGTVAVTVDMPNGQVCYTFTGVQGIELPAAAAHIHRGAAGEAGDVVVPLDVVPDASGNSTGCSLADAAVLTEIAENPTGFYVNVHTSEFPDGAVRGQVLGS